jgi:hypothetical protein
MPDSTVPTAVGELVELLEAALTDVFVRFAAPIEVPDQAERVYVIDPSGYARNRGEQDIVYEAFSLRVIVEVFRDGDNPLDCVERKWEIIELIDGVLADSRFYGYDPEGGDFTEEPGQTVVNGGYVCWSTLTIPVGDRN